MIKKLNKLLNLKPSSQKIRKILLIAISGPEPDMRIVGLFADVNEEKIVKSCIICFSLMR